MQVTQRDIRGLKMFAGAAVFGACCVLVFTVRDLMGASFCFSVGLYAIAVSMSEYGSLRAEQLREELKVVRDANILKSSLTLEGALWFYVKEERYEEAAKCRSMMEDLERLEISEEGSTIKFLQP